MNSEEIGTAEVHNIPPAPQRGRRQFSRPTIVTELSRNAVYQTSQRFCSYGMTVRMEQGRNVVYQTSQCQTMLTVGSIVYQTVEGRDNRSGSRLSFPGTRPVSNLESVLVELFTPS